MFAPLAQRAAADPRLAAPDAMAPADDDAAPRTAVRSWAWFWTLLLVMCWVQFSTAWIYPPIRFGGVSAMIDSKPHAVPFQYLLWLLILFGTLLHVRSAGLERLARVLAPFALFWLAGAAAALFGMAPLAALRLLILWSLMALSAACIGLELGAPRALRPLCLAMMLTLLMSALLALALPRYGTQLAGPDAVWRGLFTNKNQLGWVSALCLVFGWHLRAAGVRKAAWALIGLSLLCLLASTSKGALVAALAALLFSSIVRRLSRHVAAGFGLAVLTVVLACLGAICLLAFPLLLEWLGRDATLTGRTEIWSAYFRSMMATPWLGEGPGAYTSLTPLTWRIASRFESFGAIVTPHNYYLGVFGDAGLFGLLGASAALVFLVLVRPLQRWTPLSAACSALGFALAVHGMVETHEVYTPGAGAFLLILMHAVAVASDTDPGPDPDPVLPDPDPDDRA
jgi:exopolysaccharide production protein ExoQ